MLDLFDIKKVYDTGDEQVHALRGVSIRFRPHEFVAILGPSGCGKTTLLNIIGGLDHYTSGDLVIGGVSTKEYRDRDWDAYRNHRVGFVFQSYNLIPHQTVLSNVELALTLSGVSRSERRERAVAALTEVGLADQIRKKPLQMSGGQMQRVAIARALVNNPEIVLADEPTGALDTETSVQIMNILKDISDRRLIVMVTHNPELAEKYATRIIRVLDGQVIDDSNPYDGESEETAGEGEKAAPVSANTEGVSDKTAPVSEKPARAKRRREKTSMSFLTALSLSLNNLLTKKTRTFLTSFAGSIGIIGIALILSLSNGIQLFIDRVQEDTLSSYPIQIENSTMDIGTMLSAFSGGTDEDFVPEDGKIYSDDQMANLSNAVIEGYRENDLAAFKAHIESDASNIRGNATIQYRYGVTPQVYLPVADHKYHAVSPSSIYGTLMTLMGMESMNGINMSVWSEMIDNQDLLDAQYTVIAGHWPEQYNEVVLVVDENHRISDMMLYALGIKPEEEFYKLFSEEGAGKPEQTVLSYDDIFALDYRLVLAADYYTEADGKVIDKHSTAAGLENIILNRSEKIRIAGIVAANPDATATSISGAIGYTSALTDYIIGKTLAKNPDGSYVYPVIGKQIENPDVDVLLGVPFYEKDLSTEEEKAEKLKTLLTESLTDPAKNALVATQYRENIEAIIFNQMLMSKMGSIAVSFPTKEALSAEISRIIDEEPMLFAQFMQSYPDLGKLPADQLKIMLAQQDQPTLLFILSTVKVYEGQDYANAVAQAISECETLTENERANKYRAYVNAPTTTDATRATLWDTYLQSVMSDSNYKKNCRLLGIADPDSPSAVYIYPVSFDAKEAISDEIRQYNADHPDSEITYTDYIGIMLSSVSTILDVITYVLIAFVGISLVVSSIMIGIITYISVLERIKEIGILRAIGASKGDVSRVFLAETLIVGFAAGMIGIIVTLILNIPINIIIRAISGFSNIGAQLPVLGGVVLVLISMALTLIAGLIPAKIAAKKEPVEALRSE